ncbi:hypothetical protein GOV03_04770 [Candidatus Woesearchaeota archaeon]|nr:hypothetical protein [Candidatus Woesearchaeota archaeon]
MVNLIFLEGIATCGKTIVQEKLANFLRSQNKKVLIVPEQKVISTFLEKGITPKKSCQKLRNVIEKQLGLNYDYIIFDRCHFSNISFFENAFDEFEEIDDLLFKIGAKVIWFYYNSDQIIARVRNSLKHRKGTGYSKHLKILTIKANSLEEENKIILDYYTKSLEIREKIATKTKLEVLRVNTTKMIQKKDYDKIIPKIASLIKSPN